MENFQFSNYTEIYIYTKMRVLNFIRNYFNTVVFLCGMLIALILDMIFYETVYIRHLVYGGIITFTTMFLIGLYIIIYKSNFCEWISKVRCACDGCSKILYNGDPIIECVKYNKSPFRMDFCCQICKKTICKKYKYIGNLEYEDIVINRNSPMTFKYLSYLIIFIILNPWIFRKSGSDIMEYLLVIENKKQRTLYETLIFKQAKYFEYL